MDSTSVEPPETRYVESSGASIAYQEFGSGAVELVLVLAGAASHLELLWEEPRIVRVYERLGQFARVLTFDRLGTGLSDPADGPITLERQADDLLCVMEAAGFQCPAFVGGSDASRLGVFVAASHPEQVSALVLVGSSVASVPRWSPERMEQFKALIDQSWGTGRFAALYSPSLADDARFMRFLGRYERNSASPGMAKRLLQMSTAIDLRRFLPLVHVPTLVLHRRDDSLIPVERGRELAAGIPDARFVELEGQDNSMIAGDANAVVDEIEEFLTGARGPYEADTVLATVMFTDIVDSTRRAAEIGDRAWRDVLSAHDEIVRRELNRYRGQEVKTLGDGFLATFDGPARAIRCAHEIERALERIGVHSRAGLHSGEVELAAGDVRGIAVHIAARVGSLASAGDVLMTSTVGELVVGSGLSFEELGPTELKGAPGVWRILRLVA